MTPGEFPHGQPLDDERVRGLAGERTDLAWSRSGLAIVVCLAALAKLLVPDLSTLDSRAVVFVALCIGAIAWAFLLLWARVVTPPLMGRRVADARTLRMVAVGTAALGLVATVVALLPIR